MPIKKDLSDLIEKIEWLKQNDEEAKKIVREAHKFARFHFEKDRLKKAMKQAFREYEQRYNNWQSFNKTYLGLNNFNHNIYY